MSVFRKTSCCTLLLILTAAAMIILLASNASVGSDGMALRHYQFIVLDEEELSKQVLDVKRSQDLDSVLIQSRIADSSDNAGTFQREFSEFSGQH